VCADLLGFQIEDVLLLARMSHKKLIYDFDLPQQSICVKYFHQDQGISFIFILSDYDDCDDDDISVSMNVISFSQERAYE